MADDRLGCEGCEGVDNVTVNVFVYKMQSNPVIIQVLFSSNSICK